MMKQNKETHHALVDQRLGNHPEVSHEQLNRVSRRVGGGRLVEKSCGREKRKTTTCIYVNKTTTY